MLQHQDSSMNDSSSNGFPQRPFVEHPVKEMRSVSSINYLKGSTIASVDNVMVRYPLPVKKGAKKEEKKKKDEPPPEPKVPETMSIA